MKKIVLPLFIICFCASIAETQTPISLTPAPYIQNFNDYRGTPATVPAGWVTTSVKHQIFRGVGNGTNNSGGNRAYGLLGQTSNFDYGMGSLVNNNTGNITFCAKFKNNTGSPITELYINYNFEQWRYSSTSGITVSGLFGLAGEDLSALNHAGVATGTNGVVTSTPKTISLLGLNIPELDSFSVCFLHTNTRSNDNGLAIDDFVISIDEIVPLPVSLSGFRATAISTASVELEWVTESEENNSHFIVEHSTDGRKFSNIGHVEGAGTSLIAHHYNFVHNVAAPGNNYYRLRQVDYDGQSTLSQIRTVKLEGIKDIRLYPSIAQDEIHILMPQLTGRRVIVDVVNIQGDIKLQQEYDEPLNNFRLDVSALGKGYYFVRLITDEEIITRPFVKQ